jgi:hypothetical protein
MNGIKPQGDQRVSGQGSDAQPGEAWLSWLRSRPTLVCLVIFCVLMSASLFVYSAVQSDSLTAAVGLLLLVILANLFSLIF